jgi:hypothetical protein
MRASILLTIFLFVLTLASAAEPGLPEVTVYKDPNCGCCTKWVAYLRENDYRVTEINTTDISAYKEKHGIPARLGSCHTALVAGYVLEGHVPVADIVKLLQERPGIVGLSVPGMPVGTPGMEMGDRKDPYEVIAINKDGSHYTYSRHNQAE